MKFTPPIPLPPVLPPPFPLPQPQIFDFKDRFYPPQVDWRIRWGLKPTVKILLVYDGSINIAANAGFGVGKIIDIIENNPFYSWVDFKITCADRDGIASINAAATSHQPTFSGFRFNMAGFDINNYDQVWFFGFRPDNFAQTDANIILPQHAPLNTPAELQVLLDWMNNTQGGVLAMGDHDYLGASMCFMIPRVRNMRKWTNAQGVPSIGGPDRKDTNQPDAAAGTIQAFVAQGDAIPQPIEVLMKSGYGGGFSIHRVPHPILCGVDGIIDVLPDHPHEGVTLGKRYDGVAAHSSPVDTSQSLAYMGRPATPEYPDATAGGAKPEPEIIALGHPINTPRHSKNQNIVDNAAGTNDSTPFGLITTYDGEKAGVGRIAVDSTWHHWFNENLVGMENAGVPEYDQILNYFVNTAVWLSRKSLRSQMFTAYIWNSMVYAYDPMIFTRTSVWSLGLKAFDVIGRNAPQCLRKEWLDIFYNFDELVAVKFDPDLPCLTCPPIDVFEKAIWGGVMYEIIPLVEKYRARETSIRQKLDVKEITQSVARGMELGVATLQKTLSESVKVTTTKVNRLKEIKAKVDEKMLTLTYEPVALKFVLDKVVLNNPMFNALCKAENFGLTMRVSVGGTPVKGSPFNLKMERNKGFKALEKDTTALMVEPRSFVFKDKFDPGESLYLELFLHENGRNGEEIKIWELFFSQSPEKWVGRHGPDFNALLHGKTSAGVWISVEKA